MDFAKARYSFSISVSVKGRNRRAAVEPLQNARVGWELSQFAGFTLPFFRRMETGNKFLITQQQEVGSYSAWDGPKRGYWAM